MNDNYMKETRGKAMEDGLIHKRKILVFSYRNVEMKCRITVEPKCRYRVVVSLMKPDLNVRPVCRCGANLNELIKLVKTKFARELYERIPTGLDVL